MMKRPYRTLLAIASGFALSLSLANAQTFLEFNNSSSNTTGGAPGTISIAAGGTFVLSLQINTTQTANSVDYWLTQAFGPTAGVFSIVGRDYTGSAISDPSATNTQITAATDMRSNSASFGPSDGVADNLLGPRNAFDLGSSTDTGADTGPGLLQIATFTIMVSGNATPGTYGLQSFDYSGFGWSNTALADQPFNSQAAININVVPEPSTWALVILGAIGSIGLIRLRCRRA